MKKKYPKIILATFTATLTLVFFNNFAFLSWKKPTRLTVESVHEASRIAHAKELLGSEYLGSDAQGFEGKAS
ncbi:MAG: lytic transglycosylase domain-containing protein, partial [Bdellovibrio sp.]